jgi:hypothetical protein
MSEAQVRLRRISAIALPIGIAGGVACIAGFIFDREQFFHSYLFGWFFWFGFPISCLGILLIHHLLGGAWGAVTRRFFEAGQATLPLTALLFIPLLFGLSDNYIWVRPASVAADPALAHKTPYLNVPFFIARAVVYFVIWIALAMVVNRKSHQQDQTTDPAPSAQLELLSAPALILFFLTTTFAFFDWLMSLEPHWYSTIYGLVIAAGQGVGSMALIIIMASAMAKSDARLSQALVPQRFHDLGTLLFTFVFFWAYLQFSQLVIIWYGNLKHEIPWYLHRIDGIWTFLTTLLFVIHFVVPFVLLLFRDLKRSQRKLVQIATLLLVARLIDTYWLIIPDLRSGEFPVRWTDFAVLAGIGGIWTAAFARNLGRYELLPARAPGIEKAFEPVLGQPAAHSAGGTP